MNFAKWIFLLDRRSKVFSVAVIHSLLALYGLLLTIEDMFNQQYPLSLYESIYVISYYLVHAALIGLLFLGSLNILPLLYVPWLAVFLVVFTIATFYWLESICTAGEFYIEPFIVNCVSLGFGWLSWYVVCKDFLFLLFLYQLRSPFGKQHLKAPEEY